MLSTISPHYGFVSFRLLVIRACIPAWARKLFGVSGKRSRRCCLRQRKQTALLLYKHCNHSRSSGKKKYTTSKINACHCRKMTLNQVTVLGTGAFTWLDGICRVLGAIATPAGSQETLFRVSLSRPNIECISQSDPADRLTLRGAFVLSFVI